jgi:hypothetical protein
MELVTVLILSSTKCREVNPLGERPNRHAFKYHNHERAGMFQLDKYSKDLTAWILAESSLREWEIKSFPCVCKHITGQNEHFYCNMGEICSEGLKIGSTHQAQILDNGKVRIIKSLS